MSNAFNFSSNIAPVVETMRVVVPYTIPTPEQHMQLEEHLKSPMALTSLTKKVEMFQVPHDLFHVEFEQSGERPVAVVHWSDEGWDNLAYKFLVGLAAQVKKDPKSVPRSLRMFANLMNKLTEKPVGKALIDNPRKIVIERAIEQFGPSVRAVVTERLQTWSTLS